MISASPRNRICEANETPSSRKSDVKSGLYRCGAVRALHKCFYSTRGRCSSPPSPSPFSAPRHHFEHLILSYNRGRTCGIIRHVGTDVSVGYVIDSLSFYLTFKILAFFRYFGITSSRFSHIVMYRFRYSRDKHFVHPSTCHGRHANYIRVSLERKRESRTLRKFPFSYFRVSDNLISSDHRKYAAKSRINPAAGPKFYALHMFYLYFTYGTAKIETAVDVNSL